MLLKTFPHTLWSCLQELLKKQISSSISETKYKIVDICIYEQSRYLTCQKWWECYPQGPLTWLFPVYHKCLSSKKMCFFSSYTQKHTFFLVSTPWGHSFWNCLNQTLEDWVTFHYQPNHSKYPHYCFCITWSGPRSSRWDSPAPPSLRGRAQSWQNEASLTISSGEIFQVCTAANLAKCPRVFWSSWHLWSSGIGNIFFYLHSCVRGSSENTFVRLFTPF